MTMPRFPAAAVRLALVREAPGTSRIRVPVHHAQAAYEAVAPVLQDLAQERFIALLLDVRKQLISVATISEGSMTACAVDPKVLFSSALVGAADALVLAHNHPSGSSDPSLEDLELTRVLVAAGKLLRLPVLDHIIVGADEFTSLHQRRPHLFSAR